MAAETNGLTSSNMHPWHLSATVTRYDDKDVESKRGTYEEFWVAPDHYKILYTTDKFQQTVLRTPDGVFISGSEGMPPEFLLLDVSLVLAPIADPALPGAPVVKKVERQTKKFGATQLDCLSENFGRTSYGDTLGPTYCLGQNSSMLRAVSDSYGMAQTLFNQIVQLNGQFIARTVTHTWNQKKQVEIQVTQLGALATTEQVEQSAPAGFVRATAPLEFSSRAGVDHLMLNVPPVYPIEAKQSRVQGKVELKAHLDVSGQVTGLEFVSGPKQLASPALEAVRQWRYKPFIVNGQPSACSITVNVIFTLGG